MEGPHNCTLGANCTSEEMGSGTFFSDPPFASFFVILFMIITITSVLLAITIVSTLLTTSMLTIIRLFVLNQLVACSIYQLSPALFLSTSAVYSAMGGGSSLTNSSTLGFCQFISWLLAFGATGRSWCLALFAVFTLIITTRGIVKLAYVITSISCVWIITFILCIYATIPYPQYPAYAVHYFDNVQCFPLSSEIPPEIRISTVTLWIVFGTVIPLTTAITIPIITLCYIKRHTVTEGSEYNKRIAHFALFLLTGNIVNFISRTIPVILSLMNNLVVGIIISNILITISTIPTPLIVILYMKPIYNTLKKACGCFRKKKAGSKKDHTSTENI